VNDRVDALAELLDLIHFGQIGLGKGKAKEVPVAVQKAVKEANKNMVKVSLKNGTIHHTVSATHGATTVYMQPAKEGTGIIAGGAMRALFDAIGVKNITAKVHGSTNPYNVVRATIKGLQAITTPAEIAAKRGKTVEEILGE
jgi:small subunit ribosomal protein S5